MVCAGRVRVVPLWERRLVDPSERYHSHLVATKDGKRSSYVIGIGVNPGAGLGGKFLVALETAPKWVLLAGRVGVGAGAWGGSLWMGAGALVCTGAKLEESLARAEKLG